MVAQEQRKKLDSRKTCEEGKGYHRLFLHLKLFDKPITSRYIVVLTLQISYLLAGLGVNRFGCYKKKRKA